jgi:DnaJ homolog subfamily C member 19
LLGVAPNADIDTVLDAHRRLIAKVHPDAGGSAELAAQINLARDRMLKP